MVHHFGSIGNEIRFRFEQLRPSSINFLDSGRQMYYIIVIIIKLSLLWKKSLIRSIVEYDTKFFSHNTQVFTTIHNYGSVVKAITDYWHCFKSCVTNDFPENKQAQVRVPAHIHWHTPSGNLRLFNHSFLKDTFITRERYR